MTADMNMMKAKVPEEESWPADPTGFSVVLGLTDLPSCFSTWGTLSVIRRWAPWLVSLSTTPSMVSQR